MSSPLLRIYLPGWTHLPLLEYPEAAAPPCPFAFRQSHVIRFGQEVVSRGDVYLFWTKM